MTEYNVDPTNKGGLFSSFNFKPTLEEILATAKTGDVIVLSSGTYELNKDINLTPVHGRNNAAVLNDIDYVDAYKKTSREDEMPIDALIIRGASDNADDVHLVGKITINNSNVIFENITVENRTDVLAVIGDNASNLTFINCILTKAIGDNTSILLGNDVDTTINLFSSYVAEKEKMANIYFAGPLYMYNTNLESGVVLRDKAAVIAMQSNLNWAEAYDNSYFGGVSSKFLGTYYYATDSAKIEFYSSTIKLWNNQFFAKGEKNAEFLGKDVQFEGSEHVPTIEILDNAKAQFNIINQNDFFADKQVKIVTGEEDKEDDEFDVDNLEFIDDDPDFDDQDFTDTNDEDYSNKVIVSNDQELLEAVKTSTNGTVIFLKAGSYNYDSNTNYFNSLTLEGESLADTSLTVSVQFIVQSGCTLTLNNLQINEGTDCEDNSIIAAGEDNTKIVLNNCVLTNLNKESALISAQASGANVELNCVSIVNVNGGIDVAAGYGGKVKIVDSYIPSILAANNGVMSISTSNIFWVSAENNGTVNVDNSVITLEISAAQSIINLAHVTIDPLNSDGMLIVADQNSQIVFSRSVFHNEHGQIKCELYDQSKLTLRLWRYNNDYPITVKCDNPSEQVDNIQDWTLNFEN